MIGFVNQFQNNIESTEFHYRDVHMSKINHQI